MLEPNDVVRILDKNAVGVIDLRSDKGGKPLYYRVIVGGNMASQGLYTEDQLELISRPAPKVI